ncbi:hypothetical protein QM012_009577 [Aureobasidium pullulans]|uniref:Fungal N-terminal domain-containing protein n=1 Tax=Aureobasidium pullulans TaxID=5580 RepID=A0ABR0TIB7_AURPU
MADFQELLTTVRDIYQNVSDLYGLIKIHERDLVVVEKADSFMEDARANLLYLNDCIHNRVSESSHASLGSTNKDTATKSTGKLLEDEMKRQVESTMRHMMTEMVELLERKHSCCSTDSSMGCTQSIKHSLPVDDSADFDIL